MALDVGDRRIGMAVSDPTGLIASPAGFITRRGLERDVEIIISKARELKAERIVVGMPLDSRGEVGEQGRRVQVLVEVLEGASPVAVETWDERFSTLEAEGFMREIGRKPSREKGASDAAAAAVILQGWLDKRRKG